MNSGYFYLNGSRIQTNTEIITYQRSNSMDTDETDGDNENYSLISSPNQVYCDISGGDIESQDSYDWQQLVLLFDELSPFMKPERKQILTAFVDRNSFLFSTN